MFYDSAARDCYLLLNSLLASGDFCCLLITFANSLDPGPDLDPIHLTL